jgi:hypothetical protein
VKVSLSSVCSLSNVTTPYAMLGSSHQSGIAPFVDETISGGSSGKTGLLDGCCGLCVFKGDLHGGATYVTALGGTTCVLEFCPVSSSPGRDVLNSSAILAQHSSFLPILSEAIRRPEFVILIPPVPNKEPRGPRYAGEYVSMFLDDRQRVIAAQRIAINPSPQPTPPAIKAILRVALRVVSSSVPDHGCVAFCNLVEKALVKRKKA